MFFRDSWKLALTALRVNRGRSILTSLGIIIGIAAVIIIISVGAGAQSLIINQLNSVGTNLIGVLPGASETDGPPASAFGIVVTTLKYEDAVAIGEEVPHISAVTSYNTGRGSIVYQSNKVTANFSGVMASYPQVEEIELARGRFFTDEEDKSSSRVVVLGYQVWQDLFGGDDPIGKKIKIKKETFSVIGVIDERGTVGFQNQDNIVFVPSLTAQKILLGVKYINYLRAKVDSSDNVEQASNDVTLLLRDRHDINNGKKDDFSVRNTKDSIEILLNITNALKFFLAAIAAISLIVGGVGIMNIMLASVNERTREIGLRMAVGAKEGDVSRQFILETIALTFLGGLIGIAIGAVVSFLVFFVARYLDYKWDLVITPQSIILGFGVSVLIGLIFGYYPAKRASKLNPIVALRYE